MGNTQFRSPVMESCVGTVRTTFGTPNFVASFCVLPQYKAGYENE